MTDTPVCCICHEAGGEMVSTESDHLGRPYWRHMGGCSPWAHAFDNEPWALAHRRMALPPAAGVLHCSSTVWPPIVIVDYAPRSEWKPRYRLRDGLHWEIF